jgi:outer membrane protein OmpU
LNEINEGKTMKKVLFATTALVATAGVAAADIDFSGNAELGFQYDDNGSATGGAATTLWNNANLDVALSGETGSGLSFGANLDSNEAGGNTDDGGTNVFISGGWGTLTVGDTDGALDWAVTERVFNAGSIADDETAHDGYWGGSYLDSAYDGQVARYDHSVGSLGFALAVTGDDTGAGDTVIGVGLTYAWRSFDFGFGYEFAGDANGLGLSVAYAADSGLEAGLAYGMAEDVAGAGIDTTNIQLSAGYDFGAFAVGFNYGIAESTNAGVTTDTTGFGLSGSYDLGGGAALHLGIGSDDDDLTMSFGVAMGF